jgi:hypothetical protein
MQFLRNSRKIPVKFFQNFFNEPTLGANPHHLIDLIKVAIIRKQMKRQSPCFGLGERLLGVREERQRVRQMRDEREGGGGGKIGGKYVIGVCMFCIKIGVLFFIRVALVFILVRGMINLIGIGKRVLEVDPSLLTQGRERVEAVDSQR